MRTSEIAELSVMDKLVHYKMIKKLISDCLKPNSGKTENKLFKFSSAFKAAVVPMESSQWTSGSS